MTLTTVAQFGQIARAMAQVQQHRSPDGARSGRITCPKCSSGLTFTVLPNGKSRGQCAAYRCLRWNQ